MYTRREKICHTHTSSINKTPGTISALPSSRHSPTLLLIWSRTSDLISPVSPIECKIRDFLKFQGWKIKLVCGAHQRRGRENPEFYYWLHQSRARWLYESLLSAFVIHLRVQKKKKKWRKNIGPWRRKPALRPKWDCRQFTFGTLNKSGLRSSCIVISGPSKRSPKLRDFPCGFVDGYDVSSLCLSSKKKYIR